MSRIEETPKGRVAAARLYDRAKDLPAGLLERCRPMPMPGTLLMCPPDHFEVRDVKNPHMEGNVGKVDHASAARQWKEVRRAFQDCGAKVEVLPPTPDCEDMVFCANQTLVGLNAEGRPVCVPSHMKHASRQREVEAFWLWFHGRGYAIETLPEGVGFEGSGDAIWHPGRGLIWGGYGFRTAPEAYETIAEVFGVPVLRMTLRSDRFYHLDTCFCAIDASTALVHPGALSVEGLAMVRRVFRNVVECDDREALEGMACNATSIGGRGVVIQRGNRKTVAALNRLGYQVLEVETSEYLKSGGSVFCLKMYVF